MMKRWFFGSLFALFSVALLQGVCLALRSNADEQADAASGKAVVRDHEDLQRTVDELTKKVGELEARIRLMEQRPLQVSGTPFVAPSNKPLPQGWQPHSFNGIEYYIVPVGPKSVRK